VTGGDATTRSPNLCASPGTLPPTRRRDRRGVADVSLASASSFAAESVSFVSGSDDRLGAGQVPPVDNGTPGDQIGMFVDRDVDGILADVTGGDLVIH
jgi:hypothetical protein